jgi:hypothetical protein
VRQTLLLRRFGNPSKMHSGSELFACTMCLRWRSPRSTGRTNIE